MQTQLTLEEIKRIIFSELLKVIETNREDEDDDFLIISDFGGDGIISLKTFRHGPK